MKVQKIFFGETFLCGNDLIETAIKHLIKLKYYKMKSIVNDENKDIYGIEIVKEEYMNDIIKTEKNKISLLTENEEVANNILRKVIDNKVTPIGLEDSAYDLLKAYQ